MTDFDKFDHDDAWRLGSDLVAECRARQLPVTIGIHLGEQRVFHAALPGTSADNDHWAMRKTRVVWRFDRSSHEVGEAYGRDFHIGFGLSAAEYAPTGGAVPIRVRGSLVGVLAVSGLTSADDHDLGMAALDRLRGRADA